REKRRILDHYQFLPTMARIIRGHRLAERLTIKLLNLDRRPDRLKTFREAALAKAGARFLERCERFRAVDGESLVMDDDIRHLFRGNDFNYRRGMIGCALSHLEIWKEAAKTDDATFLVFEDDVRLTDDFGGQLVEVCGALAEDHPNFDLVILGYQLWEGAEAQQARMEAMAHLSARLSPIA
ncbi:MAG: glycosyltransferase family 25 protein, partial [Acidobacteriota bacterium]